ncbi:MAG: o-succinylbenzoate synthase [Planctomycetes bacterium]|nr:o-succinylbenzoate synthase [Planctomycetota bacterium]
MARARWRIERIHITHLRLPLVRPFETSFGVETVKDTILVRVDAEGLSGFGEAPVHGRPSYSADDVVTTLHVLEDFLAPALIGRSLCGPEDLESEVAGVRGHRFARAALEGALADLAAQAAGLPLFRYYGARRERIAVGVSIGIQPNRGALLERIAGHLAEGYGRIKVKIKPGWDVAVLEAIRAHFPAVMLFADANAAYTLRDLPVLEALDRHGLALLEQPLGHEDLLDHARLRARLATPICLDESLAGPAVSRAALRLGAAGAVNIKMARMGGSVASRRLARCARRLGLAVFCGGMLESGVGRAHNLALAALPDFTLPGDISAADRYYREDIVDPPARLGPGGCLALPDAPGIGVTVLEDRVAVLAQHRRVVGAAACGTRPGHSGGRGDRGPE